MTRYNIDYQSASIPGNSFANLDSEKKNSNYFFSPLKLATDSDSNGKNL